MKRNYVVNGKVTYPQSAGQSVTTFSFYDAETNNMFNLQTTDETERNSLNYGDSVELTIETDGAV